MSPFTTQLFTAVTSPSDPFETFIIIENWKMYAMTKFLENV